MNAPHREPLCIDDAHPALAGHFPDNPVVPGVMLLERVLDAAQRCFGLRTDELQMPQVKFLRSLLPEQTAELVLERMVSDATNPGNMRIRFRIEREDALLASGELIASTAIAAVSHATNFV